MAHVEGADGDFGMAAQDEGAQAEKAIALRTAGRECPEILEVGVEVFAFGEAVGFEQGGIRRGVVGHEGHGGTVEAVDEEAALGVHGRIDGAARRDEAAGAEPGFGGGEE